MKVSVVIPLYNKARHIQRALDSVLVQTFQDFEIIVVDDGSTDGGGDVVRKIRDKRIKLFTQVNMGISGARNRGIKESLFEQVAFLDADDEWLPEFLEIVNGLHARHPDAGVFAAAYYYGEQYGPRRLGYIDCPENREGGLLNNYFISALGPNPLSCSSVMVPKNVLKEVGYFPLGYKRGEDIHTWVKIALKFNVAWAPAEGAIYHQETDNRITADCEVVSDIAAARALEEFLHSGSESIIPYDTVREYVAFWRLRLAWGCYLSGSKCSASELIEKTRRTLKYKNRRKILRGILWVPPVIVNGVLAIRRKLLHFARLVCDL